MQKILGGKNSRQRNDLIFYIFLLAIPVLHFTIFYVILNFNSFLLAFQKYNSDTGAFAWTGLNNFKELFQSFKLLTVYGKAFKNTLIVFVVGTATGTTLGLAFAYYIFKKAPMKRFFKIMLFLPSIIPAIAMVTMFSQFVENAVPALANNLFNVTIKGLIQNPKTTLGTIIFYNVWVGFGVSILLYLGSMTGISDSVIEASHIDGVNFIQEFIYIVFPLIFGTFKTFIITGFGGIFISQANLFSFFGYSFEEDYVTVGFYLYRQTVMNANSYAQFPFLSAFGLFLTLITLPLVFGVSRLLKKVGPSME